ncbi:marine proteobacterial sortase target protein [Psychromonas antarctica]|uniref:marine proteobacterial sortase target protein n=1 Tax=Psychromonas antarctica TaxID=67573 RepID=UPI001EE86C80|nr:marine proteobacterial sortase target protein [Psychromonas antarctica]MCG6200867.1 marine proteobacterial sortase target protein [Psychromonas antarctica]
MCQSKLKNNFHILPLKIVLLVCGFISPYIFAGEQSDIAPLTGLVYETDGAKISAPLLSSSVKMDVNGLINRVAITQVFENESGHWINADYIFPLPENAALDHLTMTIGKRLIVGEIKEKMIATRAFEKAKIEGKKASLIAHKRNDIFTTQVANIGPGEMISIKIEYQQRIQYKAGLFSLYFPMAITPRYAPPMPQLGRVARQDYLAHLLMGSDDSAENLLWSERWDSWLLDDESRQLAEQTIQTIKKGADPSLLLKIKIVLNTPLETAQIVSPSHVINIHKLHAGAQLISLQKDAVIANRDFVLNWQLLQSDKAESALFVECMSSETSLGDKPATDKYGLLMLMPPAAQYTEAARINKEVVFVIDVSGSMSGTSIRQAKSALNFAVEQLAENDRFNIISFSDNSEFFATNSLPVDNRSKAMAHTFINQLQASGGTNMALALTDSLLGQRNVYPDQKTALRQVVFITDASISNEQQLLTQIESQKGDSRLFMVGIGSAPNHYFMKSSAKLGKGTYTRIGDLNQVDMKMSTLFAQLSAPVMRDITLQWADGSVVDYWPQPITDLYQGDPLQVTFKIPEGKTSLHIGGVRFIQNRATPWSENFAVAEQQGAKGIAVLWAKEQIDSINLNRQFSSIEKQQKITALGLKFHIVTEHTSLLAVEQNRSRPSLTNSFDKQVKTELPQGNTMYLPQTGLASELYQQLGLLLLLLVSLLWLAEPCLCQNKRIKEGLTWFQQ